MAKKETNKKLFVAIGVNHIEGFYTVAEGLTKKDAAWRVIHDCEADTVVQFLELTVPAVTADVEKIPTTKVAL